MANESQIAQLNAQKANTELQLTRVKNRGPEIDKELTAHESQWEAAKVRLAEEKAQWPNAVAELEARIVAIDKQVTELSKA